MEEQPQRIRWTEVPITFAPLIIIRCPECKSDRKPVIVNTTTEDDGSITRRCICRECGAPSLLVLEPIENKVQFLDF
ncbi:hypothetical protein U8335_02295 [Roseiconus lacunae]|uniref:hypothetical protein n=1 Tax=Roseiconus lacunae TaxID=2605694 RepID=UPI003093C7BF|nr:hypothetical protein U8335_02295 [Stieleria sp. HD01]